jgi:PPOX class probable F420-dependent enzyme
LLHSARRAVLGTTARDGLPRLVPLAYAVVNSESGVVLYSLIDDKPKSVADPRELARVRDIVARPRASVLVDRWSEDWTELAWLRLECFAELMEPTDPPSAEQAQAVQLLRERYPQYAPRHLEKWPLLRLAVERVVGWAAAPDRG